MGLTERIDTPACKVWWQTKSRFWEEKNQIYGGISWTDHIISQIWYPSNSFQANIGVLTGAYNSGSSARIFGEYPHQARLEIALQGGEKFHPGFQKMVDKELGLSIAWHKNGTLFRRVATL